MVDKEIHNFYMYFTIFLFSVALLLGFGLFYVDNKEKSADPVENIVILDTNYGEIKIELFLTQSPITANNFRDLVASGFYDRTKFHRIIDGFMIQGGDPLSKDLTNQAAWGTGGSDTVIEDEFIEGLSNKQWTISMANSGPNSGSSQFFINLQDNVNLDWDKQPSSSKHPVFGKVISGFEVIEKIASVETTGSPFDRPIESVVINKATMSFN